MAFDSSILADGFLDLQSDPPENETDAIDRMADILSDYFKTAEANAAIPINSVSVDGQLATIKSGLAGMKATGPVAVQTACVAFWTAVVGAVPSFFAGCATPAVLSTSLSTMSGLMLAAAATTLAEEKSPEDATQALADAVHDGHTLVPTTITLTSGPTVVTIE